MIREISKYETRIYSDVVEIWKKGHDLAECVSMSQFVFEANIQIWENLKPAERENYDNDLLFFIVELSVYTIEMDLGRKVKRHWEN